MKNQNCGLDAHIYTYKAQRLIVIPAFKRIQIFTQELAGIKHVRSNLKLYKASYLKFVIIKKVKCMIFIITTFKKYVTRIFSCYLLTLYT